MNMGRVLRSAHGWARQRLAAWLVERLHATPESRSRAMNLTTYRCEHDD
jgi:hypothetical protein